MTLSDLLNDKNILLFTLPTICYLKDYFMHKKALTEAKTHLNIFYENAKNPSNYFNNRYKKYKRSFTEQIDKDTYYTFSMLNAVVHTVGGILIYNSLKEQGFSFETLQENAGYIASYLPLIIKEKIQSKEKNKLSNFYLSQSIAKFNPSNPHTN